VGAKSEGGLSKSAGSGIRTHEPLMGVILLRILDLFFHFMISPMFPVT